MGKPKSNSTFQEGWLDTPGMLSARAMRRLPEPVSLWKGVVQSWECAKRLNYRVARGALWLIS